MILYQIDPPECPKCKHEENIINVCKNCGYEYKEQKLSIIEKIIVFGLRLFVIWLIFTILYWLFCNIDNKTFIDMIKNQWYFISKLKIF